ERVAIKTRDLALLPDAVSFEDASTLPVAALTALRALELGGLLLGKRVLVTGAAGGVGRFAIQLGRRAGAHVTGIVGRPERGEGLRELGADEIVTAVDRDKRYDLVLESVGGESLETSVAVLAPAGTVVVYGNSSERPASIDARALFIKGRTNVRGLFIFDEIEHDFSAARGLAYLASLIADGALKTEIAMTRPWTETAAALEELSARRVAGKAVLVIE
ncbi:MAG TPA: zinc-binding dehydrogenase, partial [Thermoanaerobaculia bacterium]|nr:zinc-binding dehydrogenase [Thermoanaerobaculia bacterium]